jgi:hypothetical protein
MDVDIFIFATYCNIFAIIDKNNTEENILGMKTGN